MTATPNDLAAKLRDTCDKLRVKPIPLVDLIPLLQECADALSTTERQMPDVQAWLHCYRRVRGGERYCVAEIGDATDHPKDHPPPKDGFEWVRRDALVLASTPPAQAERKPLFGELIAAHEGLAEELAQAEPTDPLEALTREQERLGLYDGVFAQAEPTAGEPFAYYVYFPDQQRGELVFDLDDVCEDMTNDENHTVTPLYPAPKEPI